MESQEQRVPKYSRNTELRHLDPADVYNLGLILDKEHSWKKLMEIIPKVLDSQKASEDGKLDLNSDGAKYSDVHINSIEDSTKRLNHDRQYTVTLIEEWSTSGKKNERPTVGVLLQLLVKADLFRAAHFVAKDLLAEEDPARPLEGPARKIDIPLNSDMFGSILSNGYPDTEELNQNCSSVNVNKDLYTKYRNIEKDRNAATDNSKPIPPPRHGRNSRLKKLDQNQQQNSNSLTIEGTTATLNKISKTSTNGTLEPIPERDSNSSGATMPMNQEFQMQPTVYKKNSNNSQLDSIDSNPLTTNTESTQLSSAILPNLSIFATSAIIETNINNDLTTSTTTTNMVQEVHSNNFNEILPTLSALNLNGEHSDRELDCRSISPPSERSNSNLDDDISYPNDSRDDENGHSIPNLSIFGERQSNNDSSLTSVTGTSGENSFELSTNESISSASNDENLPILSIFNQ